MIIDGSRNNSNTSVDLKFLKKTIQLLYSAKEEGLDHSIPIYCDSPSPRNRGPKAKKNIAKGKGLKEETNEGPKKSTKKAPKKAKKKVVKKTETETQNWTYEQAPEIEPEEEGVTSELNTPSD